MVQFLGFRSETHALANTIQLVTIKADQFGAVFYPGGHGPLWDLANDEDSIALIQKMITTEKAVALVCHVPGVLKDVMLDGAPLVKGRQVTGFSNTEEEAAYLTKMVPFLVEDELKQLGGLYAKGPDWGAFIKVDGNLITGQNPASSAPGVCSILKLIQAKEALETVSR